MNFIMFRAGYHGKITSLLSAVLVQGHRGPLIGTTIITLSGMILYCSYLLRQ